MPRGRGFTRATTAAAGLVQNLRLACALVVTQELRLHEAAPSTPNLSDG